MVRPELPGELLDAVYEAALDSRLWAAALPLLTKTFDCSAATLRILDPKRGIAVISASGADDAIVADYVDHYYALDFVTEQSRSYRSGDVFAFQNLLDAEPYRRHPYSQEHLRRADCSHIIGTSVAMPAGWEFGIGVSRGGRQDRFDEGEIAAFTELIPHIARALRLQSFIGAGGPEGVPPSALALGMLIVVDGSHAIRAISPAAEGALRRDRLPVSVSGNRLRGRSPIDEDELARLVARGIGRDGHSPRGGSYVTSWNGVRYLATAVPVSDRGFYRFSLESGEPCVAIILAIDGLSPPSDGRRSSESRSPAFRGLTSTESAIVALIEQGMTVREIAKRRGVSYETVRFHVRNILRKVGARNQKQLIGLMTSGRQA
jgi:DNA-binding CsgD family transcriptional regulator